MAVTALALATSLSSCSVLTSLDGSTESAQQAPDAPGAATLDDALAGLGGTENLSEHGAEHILSGDINREGKAVGYHSVALGPLAAGQIVPGTAGAVDGDGLYEAQVTVSGTAKSGNGGYSTFFPDAWSAQQVVDAINEAYASRVDTGDGGFDGVTSGGITVHMYVDDLGLVTTAYPVMED